MDRLALRWEKFVALLCIAIVLGMLGVMVTGCGGGTPSVCKVSGFVKDAVTRRGIEGALVTVGGKSGVTNLQGAFEIDSVPTGTRTLTVVADAYESYSTTLQLSSSTYVIGDILLARSRPGVYSRDLSSGSGSLTIPAYSSNEFLLVALFPRDDTGAYQHISSVSTSLENPPALPTAPRLGPLGTAKMGVSGRTTTDDDIQAARDLFFRILEKETLAEHRQARLLSAVKAITPDPPLGSRDSFWVFPDGYPRAEPREAVLKAKGTNSLLWVDINVPMSQSDAQWLCDTFETRIRPRCLQHFGREPSTYTFPVLATAGERTNILITWLTGKGGYFSPIDLYSASQYPYSNERKMIYIGYTSDLWYMATGAAHELQHMIFYNETVLCGRHRSVNDIWINEGFSCLAEDLCGFGYEQGMGHPEAVRDFMKTPWETSLIKWEGKRTNYGASYLFTRYLFDRFGPDLPLFVSTSPLDPKDSISARSGMEFHRIFGDWAVTLCVHSFPGNTNPKYRYRTLTLPPVYGYRLTPGSSFSSYPNCKGWAIMYTWIDAGNGLDLKIDIKVATSGSFWATIARW